MANTLISSQPPPPVPMPPTHSSQTFGLSMVEGDNTMDGQRPKIWSLAQTATSAEAASAAAAAASLAGRLYHTTTAADWSTAAAAHYAAAQQFQSGQNFSDNLSLINP
ncbi:hypothetical protein BLA29_012909, partial [Euroglyphus maynei]